MSDNHLTPHDKFFRSTMVDPRIAREFFEQNLPANIKEVIDFSTIQLEPESHIDDKLKQQITDLLYYAEFSGSPGYIYVLIEHQSTPDPLMSFRLIKYMLAIMEDHLKKTKDGILPVIYPCVFYTGDKKYNYSTDIFDLFGDNKALAKSILWAPYQLIDLSKIPDEKLKEYLRYGVMAIIMKHVYKKNFLVTFRDLISDLRAIEDFGEVGYIHAIISYIICAGEVRGQQEFKEFVKIIEAGLTKVSRGDIMTIAEQFRQEGKQEGIQEGMQKGKQEGRQEGRQEAIETMLLRFFNQGLGFEQIVALTGLAPEQIEAIKNKVKQQH